MFAQFSNLIQCEGCQLEFYSRNLSLIIEDIAALQALRALSPLNNFEPFKKRNLILVLR